MNTPLYSFRYAVSTEIVFSRGAVRDMGAHVKRFGAKPLIVTGKHSARAIGALDIALAQLPNAVVFEAIDENPGAAICAEGAAICRQQGCDVVLAIGGGSPIDAAKAIAVLARNDGSCADYFGSDKYPNTPLPIVAVPTTAGTGSEVTPYSVLVDEVERTKRTITGVSLFPKVALLDPELTRSVPRDVTIATGFDALSQCMEGIVSKKSTPIGDALALDGIRRIWEHLPRAVENGDDLDAREQMLYASMLSGCVIAQSGTTLVHGMGYYYTVECGTAHGLANALLLAPLFTHNAAYIGYSIDAILKSMNFQNGNIADAIYSLFERLDVSPAARDHGVQPTQLERFAMEIAKDPYRFRNQPGEVSEKSILKWYEQSVCGAIG